MLVSTRQRFGAALPAIDMDQLLVTVGDVELEARWLADNPDVRRSVEAALPLSVDGRRWGEELYGRVSLDPAVETVATRVDPGTLAYWPDGPALCLFWGPTPASTDATPVAASPVAPFAMLETVAPLDTIDGGARITLEAT